MHLDVAMFDEEIDSFFVQLLFIPVDFIKKSVETGLIGGIDKLVGNSGDGFIVPDHESGEVVGEVFALAFVVEKVGEFLDGFFDNRRSLDDTRHRVPSVAGGMSTYIYVTVNAILPDFHSLQKSRSKRELTRPAGSWYTNITVKNRQKYNHLKIMPLRDIPVKYKRYDDSKTLIVDNCYIPSDYKKPFAVSARPILNGLLEKGYKIVEDNQYFPYMDGMKCFGRVLVKKI